jgi:hypothetical protein
MRSLLIGLTLIIPGLTGPAAAQGHPSGWVLRLEITRDAFAGASRDTSTIPGAEVEVAPAPRLALEAGLTRGLGAWEVGFGAGYASGGLRATTDELILDDRTGDVRRFRAALQLGRRVASFGPATLHVIGGPSVDHWQVPGIGDRTTVAGRAGLTLRIPLGGIRFENSVRFGLGGSPFNARDLPPEARVRTLRTWSIGAGVAVGVGR